MNACMASLSTHVAQVAESAAAPAAAPGLTPVLTGTCTRYTQEHTWFAGTRLTRRVGSHNPRSCHEAHPSSEQLLLLPHRAAVCEPGQRPSGERHRVQRSRPVTACNKTYDLGCLFGKSLKGERASSRRAPRVSQVRSQPCASACCSGFRTPCQHTTPPSTGQQLLACCMIRSRLMLLRCNHDVQGIPPFQAATRSKTHVTATPFP